MTDDERIRVEMTGVEEFHCFRLTFNPRAEGEGQRIEIMLHARSLVDLIHKASVALCDWQVEVTVDLLHELTGMPEEEMRRRGLIG